MLAFLGMRAIPKVERVADGRYERSLSIGGVVGTLRVETGGQAPHCRHHALSEDQRPAGG